MFANMNGAGWRIRPLGNVIAVEHYFCCGLRPHCMTG